MSIKSRMMRRARHRLASLTEEVTRLRALHVEQNILLKAKDEAWQEYVNKRIAEYNAAIRATNGPRRGESAAAYQARLVEANRGNTGLPRGMR